MATFRFTWLLSSLGLLSIAASLVIASGVEEPNDVDMNPVVEERVDPDWQPHRLDYKQRSEMYLRIEAALDSPMKVYAVDLPLMYLVEHISEEYGIPILLDVAALADEGVSPEAACTFGLSGPSLRKALNLILRNVDGARLEYLIRDDVLVITTFDVAHSEQETLVYEMRHFPWLAPRVAFNLIQEGTSGEWMDIDGWGGQISLIPGGMVIRQTQPVHREVQDLLRQLAEFSAAELETPPEWQDVSDIWHQVEIWGNPGYHPALEGDGEAPR